MKTLKQLINAHKGETAYVFGKGPSLDDYDVESAGPLRFVINDVIKRVPNRTYVFANDSTASYLNLFREDDVLFQPSGNRVNKPYLFDPVFPDCQVVLFNDKYDYGAVTETREELAECIRVSAGTLCSVCQIAYVMGVKKIVAIGIDGGGVHASGTWSNRLRSNSAYDYNNIRDAFITLCDDMNIEVEFFNPNRGKAEMSNGKITVEIIRDTNASGQSLATGSVVDLLPKDASILIQCGKAIPFRGKAIETADAKPSAKTTAKKRGSK